MRVTDYIFKHLANQGIEHMFPVTGGGAMFLNDAIGKEKRLKYVCNLHRQTCTIAAEDYARISGKPGVICVTTGSGESNTITGVAGEWNTLFGIGFYSLVYWLWGDRSLYMILSVFVNMAAITNAFYKIFVFLMYFLFSGLWRNEIN